MEINRERLWEAEMVYNFNLGIGWASSGVEYAQSYRAVMLRNIGAHAKFVFTDMISSENIEHLTRNIGYLAVYLFYGLQDCPRFLYAGGFEENASHGGIYLFQNRKNGKAGFAGKEQLLRRLFCGRAVGTGSQGGNRLGRLSDPQGLLHLWQNLLGVLCAFG